MPKRVAEGEKRVQLNCLIAPATMKAIAETVAVEKVSQGVVVDRAVALLVYGEEIQKTPEPVLPVYVKKMTVQQKEPIFPNKPVPALDAMSDGRGKATVQTWKRGPRRKGDKSR